jgi:pimeloyl-ACP methyl ester carboxylesterase
MKPIVLIPGFAGSRLCIRKANRKTTTMQESKQQDRPNPKNDFINLNIFDKAWQSHFELKIDHNSSQVDIFDNIDVHDFGGVEGIRNLCDDCQKIDNLIRKIDESKTIEKSYNYKYFDAFITHLERHGYQSRFDMFGAPYDFRKVGVQEYLETFVSCFKLLLETSFDINGQRAILVAHSIGALVTYIILTEFLSQAWKERFIERFISVSAPYGGCSVALKTCLSGYPKLSLLKDRYMNVMSQSTGMTLAFPNTFAYKTSDILLTGLEADTREFSVDNFFEALPAKMKNVWLTNTREFIPSYMKNTGLPTTIITSTFDSQTDFSYVYKNLADTANREPVLTHYANGDSLIPQNSLTVHERHASAFPNYNFLRINGVEHTNILSDHRFHDIVMNYLNM